jgi:MFS superfamily sulfate permease-like transporter
MAARGIVGGDHGDRELAARLIKPGTPQRGDVALDLGIAVFVSLLSIAINVVLAVFIGILLAVLLFVVRMSRSNIRRLYRCDAVHSRRWLHGSHAMWAAGFGDKDDVFGAMGANGAQKLTLAVLAPDVSGQDFAPRRKMVNGFLADAYIIKTNQTDAHNNITNPTVGKLVAAVLQS